MPARGRRVSDGLRGPDGFPGDREGPVREVHVEPFAIAPHAVTNDEFAAFVRATGHVTSAERLRLVVRLRRASARRVPADAGGGAGALVAEGRAGADWRRPEGPGSSISERGRPPGRARLVDRRARLLPLGRRAAPERGRVGVRRPRRPRGGSAFPGATSSRPAASTAATSGRASSRAGTRSTTASTAPLPSTPSRRTASASTTRPATSGSGARTGSTRPDAPPGSAGRSSGAARTSATSPTATATAWPRAAATRPTPPPATWASAWRGLIVVAGGGTRFASRGA